MWYASTNKYVFAGAWETVSAAPLEWQGNFKKTFDGFSSWGKRPDPHKLNDFLRYYPQLLLEKYSSKEMSPEIKEDIDAFVKFASQFVDFYLRQDNVPPVTSTLLVLMGEASKILQKGGYKPVTIVSQSYKAGDTSYAQNALKMDYGHLTGLLKNGLAVSPQFLYFVVSGNDIKEEPIRASSARNSFIQYVLQTYPYTQLYLPQNRQKLLEVVKNPDAMNNPSIAQMFEASGMKDADKSWYVKSYIESYLVNAVTTSGADYMESMPVLLSWAENPSVSSLDYSNTMAFAPSQLTDTIVQLENSGNNEALKKFADGLRTRFDDLDKTEVKKLRRLPKTMAIINNVDKNDNFGYNRERIEAGLADADETIAYLEQHPERAEKIVFDEHIPRDVITKHKKVIQQKQQQIASDIGVAFTEAINSGMINKATAADDPTLMNFLMQEGVKQAGLDADDIKGYAQHLTIYRFYSHELIPFLQQTGGVNVNGADFGANASGWFMPRFLDPSDNTMKPAIFIKKDAWSTNEYMQTLADNLKMSLTSFTDAVTKHEGSHALHYLGAGDTTMHSPVLEQTFERAMRKQILNNDSLTDEQKHELLPPKTWESDEMLYLTDPSEIYARAHGDIPHLIEMFKERIETLKDNPIVAQAVENQWVDDVVGTMAGIAAGGTSPALLYKDLAEGRGWMANHPEPLKAINKILERQEAKLRAGYKEDILEERRHAMLQLLKQINEQKQLLKKAEASQDYSAQAEATTNINRLTRELELVKYRKVFNVDGIADLILAGYLRDYMQKLTDAVGAGQITTDRIVSDETNDAIKERIQQLRTMPAEEKVQQPTSMDIRALSEDLIKQSRPIPGGRMFDQLARLPAPEHAREGFYPHKMQQPASEEQVQAATKRWYRPL